MFGKIDLNPFHKNNHYMTAIAMLVATTAILINSNSNHLPVWILLGIWIFIFLLTYLMGCFAIYRYNSWRELSFDKICKVCGTIVRDDPKIKLCDCCGKMKWYSKKKRLFYGMRSGTTDSDFNENRIHEATEAIRRLKNKDTPSTGDNSITNDNLRSEP